MPKRLAFEDLLLKKWYTKVYFDSAPKCVLHYFEGLLLKNLNEAHSQQMWTMKFYLNLAQKFVLRYIEAF